MHSARAAESFSDSGTDFLRIAGIGEQPEPAIKHGFAARVGFAGNDGNSASHGFEIHNSKTFAAAGHDECIGQTEMVGFLLFGNETSEVDVPVQSQSPGFLLKTKAIVAVAENQIHQIRHFCNE